MRALLIVVALCLVAAVSAQTTYVQTATYSTNNCQGTASYTNSTFNFNQIYNSTSGSSYDGTTWKAFPDTTNGAFITTVSYADQAATQAYSASQSYNSGVFGAFPFNLNVCQQRTSTSYLVTIVGYNQGTPAPTFSGWAQAASVFNSTTLNQITTCPQASGTGVNTLYTWYGNTCRPATPVAATTQYSQNIACVDNGLLFARQVKYAGAGCSGSVVQASLSVVGVCNYGTVSNCNGASSSVPASFPNAGLITYSTAATDCSDSDSLATISLSASATCIPLGGTTYYTFSCSQINGTTYGTQTTFTDSACTQSLGTAIQWAAEPANTNGNSVSGATNLNNYCFTQKGSTTRQAFTCGFLSTTGAASSVSVSAVVLLFAAFLSLVASRQL